MSTPDTKIVKLIQELIDTRDSIDKVILTQLDNLVVLKGLKLTDVDVEAFKNGDVKYLLNSLEESLPDGNNR